MDGACALVDFAESLAIPVKFLCLLDYANSRGAVDMGLTPELLPGCEEVEHLQPGGQAGMHVDEMIAAGLSVLWVVGANPLRPNQSRDREGAFPLSLNEAADGSRLVFVNIEDGVKLRDL